MIYKSVVTPSIEWLLLWPCLPDVDWSLQQEGLLHTSIGKEDSCSVLVLFLVYGYLVRIKVVTVHLGFWVDVTDEVALESTRQTLGCFTGVIGTTLNQAQVDVGLFWVAPLLRTLT